MFCEEFQSGGLASQRMILNSSKCKLPWSAGVWGLAFLKIIVCFEKGSIKGLQVVLKRENVLLLDFIVKKSKCNSTDSNGCRDI